MLREQAAARAAADAAALAQARQAEAEAVERASRLASSASLCDALAAQLRTVESRGLEEVRARPGEAVEGEAAPARAAAAAALPAAAGEGDGAGPEPGEPREMQPRATSCDLAQSREGLEPEATREPEAARAAREEVEAAVRAELRSAEEEAQALRAELAEMRSETASVGQDKRESGSARTHSSASVGARARRSSTT